MNSLLNYDYSNYWLTITPKGELQVQEKDHLVVRWLKRIVCILTCGMIDFYAHIRAEKVAQVLIQKHNGSKPPQAAQIVRLMGMLQTKTGRKLFETLDFNPLIRKLSFGTPGSGKKSQKSTETKSVNSLS